VTKQNIQWPEASHGLCASWASCNDDDVNTVRFLMFAATAVKCRNNSQPYIPAVSSKCALCVQHEKIVEETIK